MSDQYYREALRLGQKAVSYTHLDVYKRQEQRILVAINADSQPAHVSFDVGAGAGVSLMTGEPVQFQGGAELPAYSCAYWKLD